jgi:hypothetical protein
LPRSKGKEEKITLSEDTVTEDSFRGPFTRHVKGLDDAPEEALTTDSTVVPGKLSMIEEVQRDLAEVQAYRESGRILPTGLYSEMVDLNNELRSGGMKTEDLLFFQARLRLLKAKTRQVEKRLYPDEKSIFSEAPKIPSSGEQPERFRPKPDLRIVDPDKPPVKPEIKQVTGEAEKAFNELADRQRGKPESAMVRATRKILQDEEYKHQGGIGVYTLLLEHVGDLTHRMAERGGVFGSEFVRPKVERTLNLVEHPIDAESIRNLKVPPEVAEYTETHKKLKVYNEVQWLGREAAIAIGEQTPTRAAQMLRRIKEMIDNGTYKTKSLEYDPNYQPPK